MKSVKLLGSAIGGEERGGFQEGFAEVSYVVRKGHEACGDSAFAYVDDRKAIIAVFDGVSGEPGAEQASSVAAVATLNSLKAKDSPTKDDIQEAFVEAHSNITYGFTTAAVAVVERKGRFISGSVGDSTLYSLGRKGRVRLELVPMRIVGNGTPVMDFLMQRAVVPVALGLPSDMQIYMREGRLSDGDSLLLMTDAVLDNLSVNVRKGKVSDCSGVADLTRILRGAAGIKEAVSRIRDEIVRRMDARFDIRDPDAVLVAKQDDMAIVGLRFKKG